MMNSVYHISSFHDTLLINCTLSMTNGMSKSTETLSFTFTTQKPEDLSSSGFPMLSRSDGIRTHDLCVPNAALYQTEPRFVNASDIILIKLQFVNRFFQIFLIFSNIFVYGSYTLLNMVLRRKDFGWRSAFYRICI